MGQSKIGKKKKNAPQLVVVVAVAMSKGVDLKAFGHEHVLEEKDLRVLEEKGSFENVLEGLGELVFYKEVLG